MISNNVSDVQQVNVIFRCEAQQIHSTSTTTSTITSIPVTINVTTPRMSMATNE